MQLINLLLEQRTDVLADCILDIKALCPAHQHALVDANLVHGEGKSKAQIEDLLIFRFAGLAIPAIGAGGSATKSGVEAFNELPSEFSVSPLAQQSRIVDAKGDRALEPDGTTVTNLAVASNSHWFGPALYYTVNETTPKVVKL